MLRSQLSRSNPFYSYNPPPETLNEKKMWEKDANVTKFTNICRLCGCSTENSDGGKCSACGKGIGIKSLQLVISQAKFLI